MSKKALIVDDDKITLRMLEKLLRNFGLATTLASCGREALIYALEESFDIVISDIIMPDLDGRELMHLLRLQESYSEIPMMMISGALDDEETNELLSSLTPYTRFMAKPINKKILEENLKVFQIL